jgi:hypothetical protein
MKAKKVDSFIPDAEFNKEDEKQIEFQLTTIQKLHNRNLDHSIEKPHKIGFNAIVIITKGQGIHTIDFIPYNYVKGTVFFIAKDQIHNFKINPDSDGYLLAFTDNFLNRLVVNENLNILNEMFDYIYYPAKMKLEDESYKNIESLIQVLEQEFCIKMDNFKELILGPLLEAIILKLGRKRLSQKSGPGNYCPCIGPGAGPGHEAGEPETDPAVWSLCHPDQEEAAPGMHRAHCCPKPPVQDRVRDGQSRSL